MAATRAIQLKTGIPGPRSQEILERKQRVVADPKAIYLPIVAAEAHGSSITDVDGNRFIDFTGGVGVLNVGHTHPRVVQAGEEKGGKFIPPPLTSVPYRGHVEPAGR